MITNDTDKSIREYISGNEDIEPKTLPKKERGINGPHVLLKMR